MREIVFDTETTGLDPADGHRITEIGAVELVDRIPTGVTFQRYINPECEISAESVRITGLTNAKLANEPVFSEIVDDFLEFIGDSALVAHNAPFDMKFLGAELEKLHREPLTNEVVDTLIIARQKYPGARNSLDALCQRFEIDLTVRDLHGALLDSELLADVYLELTGGRQHALLGAEEAESTQKEAVVEHEKGETRPPRNFPKNAEEMANHKVFLEKIKEPIWQKLSLKDAE